MSLGIQVNTQFVKLVTHNSTDKIVERAKVDANEAIIAHHLVSVKINDNNLKIAEMVRNIISKEESGLGKDSSAIKKNIATYERKKQNIDTEIANLVKKVSMGKNTSSHRSGVHNRIMGIKQTVHQQKLENLNNQLKVHSEIIGKLRDELNKTDVYKNDIRGYLSKTSPEMQNEFFATFSKSEINTPKIQSMFEEKLQPLLDKRDKYVAALNALSNIQSGKPAEKATVIPAAQRETSPPPDAVNNRKVSVAGKAEVTPVPQQQVKATIGKETAEATKSAIPAPPPPPMTIEPTHSVASPAPAGPTIPAPPPMPKGDKHLAASPLLPEQETTLASPKEAKVKEVKQEADTDERTMLLASIRGFTKENLKKVETTEKQPTAKSDNPLESIIKKAMDYRRPAIHQENDDVNSGVGDSDSADWD